ncbi:MAG TPA: SDR family NAD(P)-dependent oxidoreductase [Chloroflexota bacterium]|nr:SDR family NAD(P)-dependent oxidoreductase [Chloroflexota bacterium]
MPGYLDGKTALVTGGGRGIGRAVALMLADAGVEVVVAARTREEIEAVAGEIGEKALAFPVDIADPASVRRLFDAAGPVDILINSAGVIAPIGPVARISPDAWRYNIAVNLDGVFYTCHAALPHMLKAGWGRIVNVSSGAARGTTTAWSAYSAAKAGVEAFTRILAGEVGDRGVRANSLRPGVVDTEMQVEIRAAPEGAFGAANHARFVGLHEQGKLRPPEEPATLIMWLLSPDADDVNGETVYIDEPAWAAKVGLEPAQR